MCVVHDSQGPAQEGGHTPPARYPSVHVVVVLVVVVVVVVVEVVVVNGGVS